MELGKIAMISLKHEVTSMVAVGSCHGVNHSNANTRRKEFAPPPTVLCRESASDSSLGERWA